MTDQTPGELQEPAKSGTAGSRAALNCFISGGVKERLDQYVTKTGGKIWHVTDAALDEYLSARGA